MTDPRYQVVEDTTWPVDIGGEIQWQLRYHETGELREIRLVAASILSAYSHLTDPNLSLKDATAALRRARQARAFKSHTTEGTENDHR